MRAPRKYAAFGQSGGSGCPLLESAAFSELCGFETDDLSEALAVFRHSARAFLAGVEATRPAQPMEAEFASICELAEKRSANISAAGARQFFTAHFTPCRVRTDAKPHQAVNGFLTGYYEPEVEGTLTASPGFSEPVLARPEDLITFALGAGQISLRPELSAGRQSGAGKMLPYWDRHQIESGQAGGTFIPIVWLRDAAEVFLCQVQGSARVLLPGGDILRLGYAGRSGHPYTSIGRILIESGEIAQSEMSLASLKHWIRSAGQLPGQRGRLLMQRNRSYVFFKVDTRIGPHDGPVGAAGISLSPVRSIAVDRSLWHYGLPFWVDARLPWKSTAPEPFQRLMIAQDTGSAIVGPARVDIFFGSGEEAGKLAGGIRHSACVHVLLPNQQERQDA